MTEPIVRLEIRRASHRLLRITNVHSSLGPLLRAFVSEAIKSFGFDAGGIRLIENTGKMPFAVWEGFNRKFLDSKYNLLQKSHRDMCWRVVDGASDLGNTNFSKSGTFHAGDITGFISGLSDGNKRRICRLCNQFGYKSILLSPIKSGHRTIGVVHLASEKVNRLTPQAVMVIERAAIQLGTAIQRVRAEEGLRESEHRYREFFNNASDAIIVRDLKGNILEVNQAAMSLTGYTNEELQKKNIFELVTPVGFQIILSKQKSLISNMASSERYELEIVKKNGKKAVVESVTRLIKKDGQPFAVEAIIRDMTERKSAEHDLAESEKNFRALAEHSSDGILVMTFKGRYIYANRAAAEITGYRIAELLGMHVKQLTHPDEHHKIIERATRRRQGMPVERNFETVFIRKNRSSLPVELAVTRTIWYGQPSVIVVFRDIVERKRLMNYVTEVTRAQEEERKRIARELHDETIQSLAALALDIQAVTRSKPRLSEGVLRRIDELRRKTNNVIDGVRRFSYELRPEVLDQLGLIAALELLTNELSKTSRIRAHVEVTGVERRLSSDLELALFRIVQEAIQNVRKHSGASRVAVIVNYDLDNIRLTISDNGKGFTTMEGVTDLASQGKLGLIGMEERVRLFNGKLTFRSNPGKGTTIIAEIAG